MLVVTSGRLGPDFGDLDRLVGLKVLQWASPMKSENCRTISEKH